MSGEALTEALTHLRALLAQANFPLDLPRRTVARQQQQALLDQLDDYIMPRLWSLDAPLLAVIGGSTGSGKSTLVNTLVGRKVSATSVIRPTTRAAVLLHRPEDTQWFNSSRVLPNLVRSTTPSEDSRTLQLVVDDSLPVGLALLDAPDIDSIVRENRYLADQLLGAADLWLFVTSAARYADAVPWDYLKQAAQRSVALGVVLNRVPPAAKNEVPMHLGQMMTDRGLGAAPLFAVPETWVDENGLLPARTVAPIRRWLASLVKDPVTRFNVAMQTLDGAIGAQVATVSDIALAVDEQSESLRVLRQDAASAYADAARAVSVQTADGSLLRGEVLARWQDFVGTGEFFRAVERKISWFRDRILAAFKGEQPEAAQVGHAVGSELASLILAEAEAAATRAAAAWDAHPAGRPLLAVTDQDLDSVSPGFQLEITRMIQNWQSDVMTIVSTEGSSKRSKARFLALGVNGAGVALMVFVFSQTGGLTGAEIGVSGGTAVLAQRVLEAVFGEDAVRRLAKQAKAQLDNRVAALLGQQAQRYFDILDGLHVDDEWGDDLRAAARAVGKARADVHAAMPSRFAAGSTATPAIGTSEPGGEVTRGTSWRSIESGPISIHEAEEALVGEVLAPVGDPS